VEGHGAARRELFIGVASGGIAVGGRI
jgi:hypothetical protein